MAVALLGVLLLLVLRFDILLTRPLVLDEVHTQLVASRATPGQVMSDISAAIDTAPGVLHLVLWGIGKVVGLSPFVLHLFPFLLMWVGLMVVFTTLRRRFDLLPSVAGTLAVATHALAIQMTWMARFYGPWLTIAAAFAWALGLPASRRRDLWIAVLSALLCTIHWFGVISLVLMSAAVLAVYRGDVRRGLRHIAPAAAGIVVLLLFIPVLLSQRRAISVPTWIPAPDWTQAWEIARAFYVATVPIGALVIIAATLLMRRFGRGTVTTAAQEPADAASREAASVSLASLASLALMPVAIGILSITVQPAMLTRYSTVAVLAWAPLVAYTLQRVRPGVAAAGCVALLAVGATNYRSAIRGMERYARGLGAGVSAFEFALRESNLPIVFQSRHVLYPIMAEHPEGRERTLFLYLPDSALNTVFNPRGRLRLINTFVGFEQEAAMHHQRVYGFPNVRTVAQLDSLPEFLFVGTDASLPPGYKDIRRFGGAVFPNHAVRRLNDDLAQFRRAELLNRD